MNSGPPLETHHSVEVGDCLPQLAQVDCIVVGELHQQWSYLHIGVVT